MIVYVLSCHCLDWRFEMAPLIALVLGTLAARLVGSLGVDYVGSWPAAIAVGLAAMFTVTGVLELLGAVGLLYPPTRAAAAISLGVMMLAMFPANIYASRMPSPPTSMTSQLPLRTIEQIVFVGAALVVSLGG